MTPDGASGPPRDEEDAARGQGAPEHPAAFSLVLGGPLHRFLRKVHLAGDGLELHRRRIVVISLFAWLPLLVLSALDGNLLDGAVAVPFLRHIDVHVRFLVVTPLLIAAELLVHRIAPIVVGEFLRRRLVPDGARARFDAALASATRLRSSTLAEALLVAFVYGVGVLVIWRRHLPPETTAWYTTTVGAGSRLSLAGVWYGFVSVPIFQFLLLRWYFRLFVWMRLLWQMSRIRLALVPTHPDRVGGLGFLAHMAHAFVPLALAHGTLLAGMIAQRIVHEGAELPSFKGEIVAVAIFVQAVVLAPLTMFAVQLARARWAGLHEYGRLAERYVRDFDTKWLRRGPSAEPLVGSPDIQSLADLGTAFDVVRNMRVAPITRQAVLLLALGTLAPVAPLLLTIMPLDELLRLVTGALL